MKYFHDFDSIKLNRTAVACGKFDGIHIGHQALIRECQAFEKQGLNSAVFTFDESILSVLPEGARFINSPEERCLLLGELGVDYIAEYSFHQISKLHPEAFVRSILIGQMDARVVVVGEDFRFGYQRMGDVELLKRLQDKYRYELVVVPKQEDENGRVSSSRIRECILKGDMETASDMLGYDYFVLGPVVHGKKLGRTIGMPTANIPVPEHKLIPPNGVYVSRNTLESGEYYGITNIGTKPTVDGAVMGVETYLFDFNEDIYGQELRTDFLHYVRPEQKFDSVEQLQEQMHRDKEFGMEFVSNLD